MLVAIEGGPGYGSIGSAKDYATTFAGLLEHREMLLVDARGTGYSKAIDCPDMQVGRATNAIGLGACADQLGPRFDSYRTAAIADDINDVRAALGYDDDVQVYGDSYGTYLAQSYAFRHPDTLEDARPRQRLPGARGKRLVSEHLADRDPRPRGRL